MPAVNVIRAARADVDLVAPLFDAYRAFYGRTSDPDAARDFLRERLELDDSVVLMAMRPLPEMTIVGFARLYQSYSSLDMARTVVVNDLYVIPSVRRSGTARALLEAAIAVSTQNGAVRLELATQHSNEPALALYRSLGFSSDTEFTQMSLPLQR